MWRREERLEYWLDNSGQSQKHDSALGFIGRLSLKLRSGNVRGEVQEESLGIAASTSSLDDSLEPNACVKDGLGALAVGSNSLSDASQETGREDSSIRQVDLMRNARSYDVPLPDERRACIRQIATNFEPVCRHLLPTIWIPEVQNLQTPHSHPPLLIDGARYLFPNPSVKQLTTKMSELPLSQKSVEIDRLAESERSGFLREAEVMKGIPADQARLLAVFRHVPIEMISRLRFLEEKKAILYSIARETQIAKTRVHDMAAVCDERSKEIHLIPHRTRFKSVSLN